MALIQRGGRHLWRRQWLTVPYHTAHVAQEVDIYLPSTGTPPFPVVMFVHGGGWNGGNNSFNPANSPYSYLLTNGCAIVSIEYRLSTVTAWPTQIYDVTAAIRWIRANGGRYHLHGHKMGLWGYSAGALLAALAGVGAEHAALRDASMGNASVPAHVRAICTWACHSYFPDVDAQLALNGFSARCCGTASNESWLLGTTATPIDPCGGAGLTLSTEASPLTYINAKSPPWRLEHGELDTTIPWQQSEDNYDAMTTAGRTTILTRHATLNHSTLFTDTTVRDNSLGWLLTQITS